MTTFNERQATKIAKYLVAAQRLYRFGKNKVYGVYPERVAKDRILGVKNSLRFISPDAETAWGDIENSLSRLNSAYVQAEDIRGRVREDEIKNAEAITINTISQIIMSLELTNLLNFYHYMEEQFDYNSCNPEESFAYWQGECAVYDELVKLYKSMAI